MRDEDIIAISVVLGTAHSWLDRFPTKYPARSGERHDREWLEFQATVPDVVPRAPRVVDADLPVRRYRYLSSVGRAEAKARHAAGENFSAIARAMGFSEPCIRRAVLDITQATRTRSSAA